MDMIVDVDMDIAVDMNSVMDMVMDMDNAMAILEERNVEREAIITTAADVSDGIDHFSTLPDEIIVYIFKLLPKESLQNCNAVCKRFYRCSRDEHLWTHMEFTKTNIKSGAIEWILKRGVKTLSIKHTDLLRPVFEKSFIREEPDYISQLIILNLRDVNITKPSLIILLSLCPKLKELGLQQIPINDDVCIEISGLSHLLCLTLINCSGIEARGLRKMLTNLQDLCYMNISSSSLTCDAMTALVTHMPSNILRLHIGGCRKTMFDSHLKILAKRCPRLLELHLTDCRNITEETLIIICTFKQLRGISLVKCYNIGESLYIRLRNTSTLAKLRVFGTLTDKALRLIRSTFTYINVNEYNIVRPAIRKRRASI